MKKNQKKSLKRPNFFFWCVFAQKKFGKFEWFFEFLIFFNTVSFGKKTDFGEKCFFGRIGEMKIFWEKKVDAGFENFHIFLAKKRPFFQFL